MTKMAFMYDFDKTLCTRDMQEYGFIPQLGMKVKDFWDEVSVQTKQNHMDSISSYMYYMMIKAREKNIPLTKEFLKSFGKGIELFPGVDTWFDRICEYGKERDIVIEHYVISSGLQEIIEGSSIADHFTKIYASSYHYDIEGYADWPAVTVNFTNKTQFLFRIHKGTLDLADDRINEYIPTEDIAVPYSNLVYLGDGMTDVPCMSLVKNNGGNSIAVYTIDKKHPKKLIEQNRVNYTAIADYREGSLLDQIAKKIIDTINLKQQLSNIQINENHYLNQ